MLTPLEHKAACQEILQQLGGRHFVVMTGAQFISFDSKKPGPNLSLKFRGSKAATHLTINTINDLYTVTFYKCRGANVKTVKEYTGVYSEMLQDIFKDVTGLNTTLGTMKG